jgi:hypothetical protein
MDFARRRASLRNTPRQRFRKAGKEFGFAKETLRALNEHAYPDCRYGPSRNAGS